MSSIVITRSIFPRRVINGEADMLVQVSDDGRIGGVEKFHHPDVLLCIHRAEEIVYVFPNYPNRAGPPHH